MPGGCRRTPLGRRRNVPASTRSSRKRPAQDGALRLHGLLHGGHEDFARADRLGGQLDGDQRHCLLARFGVDRDRGQRWLVVKQGLKSLGFED